MSIGNLGKPPVFVEDASDWTYKKWFNDVYLYSQSGILVPNGGQLSLPVYSTHRRNLLINGDFQIWQRGTIFVSSGTTPQWTADRWAITCTSAVQNVVQASNSLPIGLLNSAKVFRTAGNTNVSIEYLATCIESNIIKSIAGLPVVLSYWIKFGSTFDAHTALVSNPKTGATNYAKFVSVCQTGTGTDEGVFAAYTGSAYLSIGKADTTKAGVWQYVSQTAVIPATATEMKVYFQFLPTAAAGDANSFYEITGIQLEPGVNPTAYDYIAFGDALHECSRFYQKSFDYGTAAAQNTGIDAGVQTGVCVVASTTLKCDLDDTSFVPTMYKTPTITYYNPRAASATAWNYRAAAFSGTAATNVNASTKRLGTKVTLLAGGDTVDDLIGIHWDASADI